MLGLAAGAEILSQVNGAARDQQFPAPPRIPHMRRHCLSFQLAFCYKPVRPEPEHSFLYVIISHILNPFLSSGKVLEDWPLSAPLPRGVFLFRTLACIAEAQQNSLSATALGKGKSILKLRRSIVKVPYEPATGYGQKCKGAAQHENTFNG
jgi:hypothetical protein